MSAACPNCGELFASMPQRKTRCKSCNQMVFLKSTPTDPLKRLVSELRAAEIDQAWSVDWENKRKVEEFDDDLAAIGVVGGSGLARLSKAIKKYEKSNNWSEKRLIASTVAGCAHMLGLDPREWEVKVAICQLRQYEPIPRWHDHLFIATGSAEPHCKLLNESKYSLARAFAEMPIPAPSCKNDLNAAGFARCQCAWLVDLDAVAAASNVNST